MSDMLGFVGCGAALYPKLYNSNGFFWIDDDLYLLDCGESSFRQHYIAGHFDRAKHVTVFITHMHTDHIGSLGTLIVYCFLKCGIKTRVFCPEKVNLLTVFNLTGVEPEHYELYGGTDEVSDCPVKMEPVRVKHHDVMVKSYGLILNVGGDVFYYSGDAAEVPERVLTGFKAGEINRMYQDTSVNDHGGCHMTLDRLKELIDPADRSRVFCMHYDGEFFDLIRAEGFQTIEGLVVKPEK